MKEVEEKTREAAFHQSTVKASSSSSSSQKCAILMSPTGQTLSIAPVNNLSWLELYQTSERKMLRPLNQPKIAAKPTGPP